MNVYISMFFFWWSDSAAPNEETAYFGMSQIPGQSQCATGQESSEARTQVIPLNNAFLNQSL